MDTRESGGSGRQWREDLRGGVSPKTKRPVAVIGRVFPEIMCFCVTCVLWGAIDNCLTVVVWGV